MSKLRENSTWNRLPPAQREPLEEWLVRLNTLILAYVRLYSLNREKFKRCETQRPGYTLALWRIWTVTSSQSFQLAVRGNCPDAPSAAQLAAGRPMFYKSRVSSDLPFSGRRWALVALTLFTLFF